MIMTIVIGLYSLVILGLLLSIDPPPVYATVE